VKANTAQARAALDRPGPEVRLVLLHGPDTAGAVALADRLAAAMGPEAERIDLDGSALRSDPARLADEAASLSLFGGARWVRVTGAGEESADALDALLSADQAGNPAVMLAPNVKATGKLVKLAIAHRYALALACYPPSPAELERRVADMARDHGLRVGAPVAERLVASCGADVAVLARELEKLALFLDAAPDRPAELTADTLDTLGASRDEAESTRLTDAVVAGDPVSLAVELSRARSEGASAVAWLRQLQRRLLSLAAMRAELDRGERVDAVMKRHRVFFREEAATAAALSRWSLPHLAAALAQTRAAERAVTAPANAGTVLAESAVLAVARAQARRR